MGSAGLDLGCEEFHGRAVEGMITEDELEEVGGRKRRGRRIGLDALFMQMRGDSKHMALWD